MPLAGKATHSVTSTRSMTPSPKLKRLARATQTSNSELAKEADV